MENSGTNEEIVELLKKLLEGQQSMAQAVSGPWLEPLKKSSERLANILERTESTFKALNRSAESEMVFTVAFTEFTTQSRDKVVALRGLAESLTEDKNTIGRLYNRLSNTLEDSDERSRKFLQSREKHLEEMYNKSIEMMNRFLEREAEKIKMLENQSSQMASNSTLDSNGEIFQEMLLSLKAIQGGIPQRTDIEAINQNLMDMKQSLRSNSTPNKNNKMQRRNVVIICLTILLGLSLFQNWFNGENSQDPSSTAIKLIDKLEGRYFCSIVQDGTEIKGFVDLVVPNDQPESGETYFRIDSESLLTTDKTPFSLHCEGIVEHSGLGIRFSACDPLLDQPLDPGRLQTNTRQKLLLSSLSNTWKLKKIG